MGFSAYGEDINAPAHDPAFMQRIAGCSVGSCIEMLRDWQAGWAEASQQHANELLREWGW